MYSKIKKLIFLINITSIFLGILSFLYFKDPLILITLVIIMLLVFLIQLACSLSYHEGTGRPREYYGLTGDKIYYVEHIFKNITILREISFSIDTKTVTLNPEIMVYCNQTNVELKDKTFITPTFDSDGLPYFEELKLPEEYQIKG